MAAAQQSSPWRAEFEDVARAVSGGMLFGIPLLYTMEVWWIGSSTDPERLFAVLLVTAVVVFMLVRTSGFRSTADVKLRDALKDTVETLALGLVSVALLLLLLREIDLGTPRGQLLGKVVYESAPFAIGIAVASSFLRRGRAESDSGSKARSDRSLNATATDVGATLLGSVFVAFNIAPTDEVPMIASAMSPEWLVLTMVATLAITYVIVFEAGFSDEEHRRSQPGVLQHPLTETVACYLVALVSSAVMLWFFQRSASGLPLAVATSQVIVLGLPAAVGGAAGRLAV